MHWKVKYNFYNINCDLGHFRRHIFHQCTSTDVTEKATKVGVILNGFKNDKSWSQSHYEELEKTADIKGAYSMGYNEVVDGLSGKYLTAAA